MLPRANVLGFEPNTFKIYHREVKQHRLADVRPDSFVENQTGGKFTILQSGESITVDIKNCNISTFVLQEDKQPNIVFPQNKHKNALYYSLTYTLKNAKTLALYGTLKYSFSEQKFILEPEFILEPMRNAGDTLEKMSAFWDDKIYRMTFRKIAICFGMVTLGYLLIYRPLKNIWLRAKAKREGVSEGQFDYFKEKVSFGAKIAGSLKCELCNSSSISYVYECGHLVACDECHQKEKEHVCTICGKKSKKFMKIFI
jgi:hypothetical protein